MKKNKINIEQIMLKMFYIFFTFLFFLYFAILPKAEAAVDTTPPIIKLNGFGLAMVAFGTTYNDAGAIALDGIDKDLTDSIVTVNPVNTNVIGVYIVTYDVTDEAGNAAYRKIRKVVVGDTIAPSIPKAYPLAGDYEENQSVSLSSTDGESGLDKIYYTVDGTTPNKKSTEYIKAISISKDTIIKAIAYDKVDNHSDVLEAKYRIDKDDNDDDDEEEDEDDNDNENDRSNEENVSGITSFSLPGSIAGISNEEEVNEGNKMIEGNTNTEEDLKQNNNEKGEIAGAETEPSGNNLTWYWIIWLLLLAGILVFIFWEKGEKNQE